MMHINFLDGLHIFDYISRRAQLNGIKLVFTVIKYQIIAMLALALLCYVFWDFQTAFSLALGAISYIIPTFTAVLILNLSSKNPTYAGTGFILSEGLKIVLALILMVSIFMAYKHIHFLPYFVGLLSASHLIFLYFLRVRHHGK